VGEDSAKSSFAGLHESYLNVRGPEDVLEHIKLVWASTWSDAAILYRKEIGLDVENSSMAVVIQQLVHGQESGVIFGRSPVDHSRAVVEAVHGLNQGLVDGTVEPDRWMIDLGTGRIVSHTPAQRLKAVVPAHRGTKLIKLTAEKRNKPPLTTHKVKHLSASPRSWPNCSARIRTSSGLTIIPDFGFSSQGRSRQPVAPKMLKTGSGI